MNGLSGTMEQAVLKESEDTLKELTQAFQNVGLTKGQIAMMLRAHADDLSPPLIITPVTVQ